MLVDVDSYEVGISPYGLHHMVGNVLEWTGTKIDRPKMFWKFDLIIRGGITRPHSIKARRNNLRQPEVGFRGVRDSKPEERSR